MDHFHLNDAEFATQFKDCSLDPQLFNHEAHLRLAWIHIKKYGEEKAIKNITEQLLAFVEHLAAKEKFNLTLTIAAIKAVNHFINRSETDNFQDFIQEHPRLNNEFKELLSFHYTTDIFNAANAKQAFLEPDLLPFT